MRSLPRTNTRAWNIIHLTRHHDACLLQSYKKYFLAWDTSLCWLGSRICRLYLCRGVRPTCLPWVAIRNAWGRKPGGWQPGGWPGYINGHVTDNTPLWSLLWLNRWIGNRSTVPIKVSLTLSHITIKHLFLYYCKIARRAVVEGQTSRRDKLCFKLRCQIFWILKLKINRSSILSRREYTCRCIPISTKANG